jgi:DNA polymerase I-like protein with 3'-5' exonuclease and polymerase domains
VKKRDYHVGGFQDPLFVPDSSWQPPSQLPDLRRCEHVALDRETKDEGLANGRGPGWAYRAGRVIGVSAAWRDGDRVRSFYAPIAHPDSACLSPEQIAKWELDHAKAGVRFVMQNAPYDVGWGDADLGVPCPERVDDTTCMAYVIDENRMEFSLDALCRWRGLPGKNTKTLREAAETYGVDPGKEMWRLPARYVGEYAEQDAVSTLLLAESLRPELRRQEVEDAYRLEMDLLPVVHAMRKRGIRVDLDRAEQARLHCLEMSSRTFQEISDRLGQTVTVDDIRRTEWLERTFDALRIKYPRAKKTDRGSFEAKWMKTSDHWLPPAIVRAKSYREAADKFIQGYVVDFAHLGRLHASINQFKSEDGGTRTYRFSYADPPLQQMPHRNEELATLIRGLFLPEEGEVWESCDYSQQEYRLIVHFAERNKLRKAAEAANRYRRDPKTDFHSMVAEMTGLARKPAKDTNFAKAYGAGASKFAAMTNKTLEEAEAIMQQYDRELPFVKELYDLCQRKAQRTGFIRLLDGARIHFDMWEPAWLSREEKARGWGSGGKIKMGFCRIEEAKERQADESHPWHGKRLVRAECRKALNGLIQGSAARQTKLAMRACWREGYLPLIQMHDELGFSQSSARDGERIAEIMRDVVKLSVPMAVDAEYGPSWGQAARTQEYDASFAAARRAAAHI